MLNRVRKDMNNNNNNNECDMRKKESDDPVACTAVGPFFYGVGSKHQLFLLSFFSAKADTPPGHIHSFVPLKSCIEKKQAKAHLGRC